MKDKELVTVVIPAFNAADFIEYAVKSCLNQTQRPLEIVVVNDGSTDSTAKLVRGLSNSVPNAEAELRVVDIGQNKGAANALNVGFSDAKGSYLCWLSADDAFVHNKKLEHQVACMKRAGALWSYYKDSYTGASLSSANVVRSSYLPRLNFLNPLFTSNSNRRLMALLFKNPINGSSIMIRKDCVDSFGQFDPITRNVDPDGDLWMRYSLLKLRLIAITGAPVFYREHWKQTSKKEQLMIYGSELTRMRILLTLEKKEMLVALVKKFTPYFPVILMSGQHFRRPFVSEFLSDYCLSHESEFNRIFIKYVCGSLSAVRKHPNYLGLNKKKFQDDLGLFMKSQVFKKFDEVLQQTIGGRTAN